MTKVVVETSEICDVDEAARLLGKGVATIWRWIRDNRITALRISGRTFIPRSEVKRLLNEK